MPYIIMFPGTMKQYKTLKEARKEVDKILAERYDKDQVDRDVEIHYTRFHKSFYSHVEEDDTTS